MLLDLVKENARDLFAQCLRFDSLAIQRLAPLIGRAVDAGHSHRAIHETMSDAGLSMSFASYKVALKRARKLLRAVPQARQDIPLPSAELPTAAQDAGAVIVELGDPPSTAPEPNAIVATPSCTPSSNPAAYSPTRVLDLLAEARRVPSSRDYAQIARDQFREKQRSLQRAAQRERRHSRSDTIDPLKEGP